MNKLITGTIASIVTVSLIAGTTYACGHRGGGQPPKINIPPVVIKVTPKPQPKPPVVVDKPVVTTPPPVATPATVVVEKVVVKEVPAPVAALPQTGLADSVLASMAGLGALTFAGAAFIRSLKLS